MGNKKRYHNVMLRFNDTEYERLRKICESYNLDISERGTVSPLLRRLVLQQGAEEKDVLPDTSNLAYNINQLVKISHYKNMRSPNSNLEREIKKSNELLHELIEIMMEERTG